MSAADKAYALILRGILDGTFPSGSRLKEEELADLVGVSRTPVREAIRRLESDGYANFIPNRGAFIAVWSHQELDDIFGLRALLEAYAARLAAVRAKPDELDELRRLAAEMEAVLDHYDEGSLDRLVELNSQFHRQLHAASGSERLTTMAAGIVDVSLAQRTWYHYDKRLLRQTAEQHREMIDAMEAGDGEWAAALATAHVLRARRVFRRSGQLEANPEG